MVPFSFGTITKLLPHSAVLSTPRELLISCFCRHPNSFLKGLCNIDPTCLDGAWYDPISSWICNENVPLKDQCLKNITVCVMQFFVILAAASMSFSSSGPFNKVIHFLIIFVIKWQIHFWIFVWNLFCLDFSFTYPLLCSASIVLHLILSSCNLLQSVILIMLDHFWALQRN